MLSGLVSNTKIIINADQIIRITPSNEKTGSVIMMHDGTKLFAHESVEDIFKALGYYREENTYDLTEKQEE